MIFSIQVLIRAAVPDEPVFISIQKGRSDHIGSKLIDKVRDDDDKSLFAATKLIKVVDLERIRNSAPGM